MTFRRRTQFPGLDPRAVQELVDLQAEIARVIEALRAEAIGQTTDTKQSGSYAVRFNERVRCLPVAAGLELNFPAATSQTQNRWIEVLKLGGGDVRIRPVGGEIQGASLATLTDPGFYYFQSDGVEGWWLQPTGGGGGGEDLAATLAIGNTTGGTDINLDATDRINIAGGGAPDISGASSIGVQAATGLSFSTTAGNAVFGTNSGIMLAQGTSLAAMTATAGEARIQASNNVRVLTGGVERYEIESTGALQVNGSVGASGNVLTSQGAGTPPIWAAPAAGGSLTLLTHEANLGTGGVSGSFTIAGAGMTPGRPVLCVQAVGPYTGKGVLEDVAEEPVWCTAVVTSATVITVYWQSARPVGGNVKFNYAVG